MEEEDGFESARSDIEDDLESQYQCKQYFDEALKRLRRNITTSSDQRMNNDVFLSFRGEDTRATFISHLYFALTHAGIKVFKDDETLPKGGQLNSLLTEIGKSKISIIVFSRNYANSRWCLRELEEIIMHCHSTKGQVVLPVFFNVLPSEVRHQSGGFGEAFADLIRRESDDQVLRWRLSLYQATSIAGFTIINPRNESKDIENIVEHVCNMLDPTNLFVADHPVGLESRVEDVISQLLNKKHSSNDVLLVGIWGMGGIGKTTIAKAIYNKIGRKFEGRSFLANIRGFWDQDSGPISLQQKLLSDIFKTTKMKIHSIESGKCLMKERLIHKRILLILDDVDNLDQLKTLLGGHEWFHPGSRILITTRDKHILKVLKVDYVYRMEEMDENESFELFSWHAFKQASPKKDFVELSRNVVAYSGGLPLALQVLGSLLFAREEISEWKGVLKKLNIIPNNEIQKKLKISFDNLDYLDQDTFLDISCFFIGMDRYVATHIMNECGFCADIGIATLIERSLVTVDRKNKLRMHDLLRDMGREIIREKKPDMVGERTRLWLHDNALDVLSKCTATNFVEGLSLMLPRTNTISVSTKAFEKMERLRLLQLGHVQLEGDYKYLSKNLKWICWHGFLKNNTPSKFYQESSVAIDLKYSNLKTVWKNPRFLEKLKFLNLSHSHYLTQTPDFSNLPNLERLILKDCSRLSMVHDTIEQLDKLTLLNLKDCKILPNPPRSMYKLKSLTTLILSGCLNIDKLEEDLEQMKSLMTLVADNTAIRKVPFSIVRSNIGYISMCGYEGSSRDVFPSLIWSWMSPKTNPLSLLQPFESFSSVVSLNMTNSSLNGLSSMINEVPKLQSLFLECGSDSQLSDVVERILDTLYAANCTQLEALPSTSEMSTSDIETLAVIDSHNGTHSSPVSQNALRCLDTLYAANCTQLEALPSTSEMSTSDIETLAVIDSHNGTHSSPVSQNALRCLLIQMGRSNQITSLEESILENFRGCGSDDYCLPGNKIPDWLTFIGEGASAIFQVPQVTCYNLRTMVLCLLYWSSQENITCGHINNVLIINYTKATIQLYKGDSVTSIEEVDSESYISNLEAGDKVEVMVVCGYGLTLKKTAVYLFYRSSIQETIMKISHPDQDNFSLDIGGGEDLHRIPETVESKSRRVNHKKLFTFFQKCFRK